MALGACATSGGKLNEAGTLHAAEIVEVESRADIIASPAVHGALEKSGVTDASIVDGSVVTVRILCCGPPSVSNPHGLYNGQALALKTGDIVEFRWPGGDHVNTVTRVLQQADQKDGPCWWDPKDEKLWRRVIYCDWMPKEGWVKQEGLSKGWYKPAAP
jgi:hypothetical protein